jgi:two-component system, OmpR family, sensor histidine kinase KdpD
MITRPPAPSAAGVHMRLTARAANSSSGRLKVFFGASPGVGKTYAMLEAAQRKKKEGLDVVIGWVETHGRAETDVLLHGLDALPARAVEHRGRTLREFDLDAALARQPGLLLLDELAHPNAPGSRHAQRWQDVEELLDRGVDVWTTLNVQHVESLNDVVARITDVPVRETVPDRILDEAEELEFVDLSPDDLLQRLHEGRVHVPEPAPRATRHFFRKGNLIALRELALRRAAERVDEDVRDYRRAHAIQRTWPVAERILVCIRPNPESGALVRAARRLAARLRAEWTVGYVETPSQPALTAAEKQALTGAFKLAEQLGAETAVLSGPSVGEAVLAHARAHNVSKVVVGKPARARWRDRAFGSPVEEILRRSGEIDVYAIAGEDGRPAGARPVRPRAGVPRSHFAWAAAIAALCTLVCWAVYPYFDDKANLSMVYLAGVAFTAVRFGRWPSVTGAAVSVAALDFFFVPPHLTFAVADAQHVVTFAVMLAVALLISTLAVRLRDQADAARQRERRTHVLYATSRELAGVTAPDDVGRAAVRQVSDVFQGPAVLFLPDEQGRLRPTPPDTSPFAAEPHEAGTAEWVFRHRRPAGRGTDTLPGAAALHVPLLAGDACLGVLAVRADEALLPLTPDHLDLLGTLARLIAAPLERARLAGDAERARVEIEAERLRNALLSSVSHDVRTPLAAIMGAATGLGAQPAAADGQTRELVATILEEADRLNRFVTNLLDMTRLEAGAVRLNREWHSVEELVGGALTRMEKPLGGRRVETAVPGDLPLVNVDALLVERLLVNLLDNAAKHAGAASTLRVRASAYQGGVEVEVADDGPGLPAGQEERVFDKFFRGGPDRPSGFGLGLAICRSIVAAHGGRIWAENRDPRGASFRFTLPVEGTPPSALPEETDEPRA